LYLKDRKRGVIIKNEAFVGLSYLDKINGNIIKANAIDDL
jgi:hypothetical protein